MDEVGSIRAGLADPLFRKVGWRILPWLTLGYIVAYLDRVNVGFAKLQMLDDLGLSETAYGVGAGIFFIGYLLFEVPSNLVLHRVGARIWIARIMITWGIVSSLMAFVGPIAHLIGTGNETVFLVLRFLLGVAEAGLFPGVILYLTYWFPVSMHSRVMAVVLLGNPVSYVVGGPLSGALMSWTGTGSLLHGWQWMFVAEAAPAALLGLGLLRALDDGIAEARWLDAAEKAELARRIAAEAPREGHGPLRGLLSHPGLWLLGAIYLLLSVGIYGINFWIPTIIHDAGVRSVLRVGLLAAIPYGIGAGTMIGIARVAERAGRRRGWAIGMSLLAGAGLIACAGFQANLVVTLVAVAAAVGGGMSAVALFWGFPGAFFQGAAAAAGIAIINALGSLGGFIGPSLLGVLTDAFGSARGGLMALGACLFGAAALMLAGARKLAAPGLVTRSVIAPVVASAGRAP